MPGLILLVAREMVLSNCDSDIPFQPSTVGGAGWCALQPAMATAV